MAKLTLGQLEAFLLQACDLLREGGSEPTDFKYYIFGMLFLKRINDQFAVTQRQASLKAEVALDDADPYKGFFVPKEGRWQWSEKGEDGQERYKGLAHLKVSDDVATELDAALDAIEAVNSKLLVEPQQRKGVFQEIRFVTKTRQLKNKVLVDLIQHFNGKRLTNEDFEFPDLMGAAYEYLLKYFADDAGKKGGQFFTPSWVVRLLVRILDPRPGMSVYDPTGGSGGMLIQAYQHIERQTPPGERVNVTLAGQELRPGTWATCKLNLILHGVLDANIKQGDTILDPQHVIDGRLQRFDRVVANPPFAQNYSPGKDGLKLKADRFPVLIPQTGKKADLMFVQHMVASLKRRAEGDAKDGRLAVIMPHGVLFRGGKEKEVRKHFLADGLLEAVIGLPPNLFYGTGIPACILVMSYDGAEGRKGDDAKVLFINADREYQTGRNQNSLRPQDIEKIIHVWRGREKEPGYSRLVPLSEIREADFNLNIRRFVDNATPPEPHDVRAHLHGGIPVSEIDALDPWLRHYTELRERLFEIPEGSAYGELAPSISEAGGVATAIHSAPGLCACHDSILATFDLWWESAELQIVALPKSHDVFDLERQLLRTLPVAMKDHTLLTAHQVRGALACFFVDQEPVLKTFAASGWVATPIPEVLAILRGELRAIFESYLRHEERSLTAAVEGLVAKYARPFHAIEKQRTERLSAFTKLLDRMGFAQ